MQLILLCQQNGGATVPTIDSMWVSLFGQLGVVAALIWFLFYQTAVAGPKRAEAQNAHNKEVSDGFKDTVRTVVADFNQNLREERQTRREELAMLRETLKCRHPGGGQ